jgi:hypothetical protein
MPSSGTPTPAVSMTVTSHNCRVSSMFRFIFKSLDFVKFNYVLPHNVPETVIISKPSTNKQKVKVLFK